MLRHFSINNGIKYLVLRSSLSINSHKYVDYSSSRFEGKIRQKSQVRHLTQDNRSLYKKDEIIKGES